MLDKQHTRLQCKPIGVIAQTSKVCFCLPQRAAQVQRGFKGFCAVVLRMNDGFTAY